MTNILTNIQPEEKIQQENTRTNIKQKKRSTAKSQGVHRNTEESHTGR